MAFSSLEHDQIAAAIAAAESNTSGEIVCVVTDKAHRYVSTGLAAAALIAFALPFAALWLGADYAQLMPWRTWTADPTGDLRAGIEAYAVVQVAIFAVAAALGARTGLGALLTPRMVKRERVHAEALSQFRARGLGRTRARTGVLIYVSMVDHIAEVVADEGIYTKVPPEFWGETIAALIAGLKAGDAARGFADAVALAGGVLAKHFPPAALDNPNELPDRLIEL